MRKLAAFALAACLSGCQVHIYLGPTSRPVEPATEVKQTTPPTPPRLHRQVRETPWRCSTCGEPMWVDGYATGHGNPGLDAGHAAKLSNADMKILVDGLRMRD